MDSINYINFPYFHFIQNIRYYFSTCFPAYAATINYEKRETIHFAVYDSRGKVRVSIPRTQDVTSGGRDFTRPSR